MALGVASAAAALATAVTPAAAQVPTVDLPAIAGGVTVTRNGSGHTIAGPPSPSVTLGVEVLGIGVNVGAGLTVGAAGPGADLEAGVDAPGVVDVEVAARLATGRAADEAGGRVSGLRVGVDVGVGVVGTEPLQVGVGVGVGVGGSAPTRGEAPREDVPAAADIPRPPRTAVPSAAPAVAAPSPGDEGAPPVRPPVPDRGATRRRPPAAVPVPVPSVAGGAPAIPGSIALPPGVPRLPPASAVTSPQIDRGSASGPAAPASAGGSPVASVVGAVAAAGRSPWVALGVLLAAVAYLLGQRLMDRNSPKLAHARGGGEPDDELIDV